MEKLSKIRDYDPFLDENMREYEMYIEENGLPYCDYRIYRSKHMNFKPIDKFRFGIKRIISILKSYKSLDLRDLLESVKEQMIKEKAMKEQKRLSFIKRGVNMTPEQKLDHIYVSLK